MRPHAGRVIPGLWILLAAHAVAAAAAPAVPIAYTAVGGQSRLDFFGTQAGAPFRATFHRFTAAIDFAPQALARSHFDVLIDLNSLDSLDHDRDATMRGSDLFDVAHWPTARYVTNTITKTAAGYAATGTLTLRGVTKDVPIEFQFSATPTGTMLTGTASVQRLDFGVGQGDWKSTEWVGNEVKIRFSLVLIAKS